MTEISPKKGAKFLQPVIELLVGIPSVVYGFIGLSVIVPFVRSIFGGTGFGKMCIRDRNNGDDHVPKLLPDVQKTSRDDWYC